MGDEPKRSMLKMEPIADDDNVLEQLCASVARIEEGLDNVAGVLVAINDELEQARSEEWTEAQKCVIDELWAAIVAADQAQEDRVTLTRERALVVIRMLGIQAVGE